MQPTRDETCIGAAVDLAALGNAYSRKNRGHGGVLDTTESRVDCIDCRGADPVAAAVQISCSLVPSAPLSEAQFAAVPAGTNFTPRVVGMLRWGTAGDHVEQVEFDFVNGTIVTCAGSEVVLSARLDDGVDPQAEDFIAPRAEAHIGYFPRGSAPAQRTRYLALEAAGDPADTAAVAVPLYARELRVMSAQGGAPLGSSLVITLEELAPFPTVFAAVASTDPVTSLPVPAGSRVLRVQNLGAQANDVAAVFGLWI